MLTETQRKRKKGHLKAKESRERKNAEKYRPGDW